MDSNKQASRIFLFMCLFALWIAASGYSVAVLLREAGAADAGTGLGPMQKFLGWQGVAGMLALAIFGLGQSFPKDSGSRNLAFVPLLAMFVLLCVVFAMKFLA